MLSFLQFGHGFFLFDTNEKEEIMRKVANTCMLTQCMMNMEGWVDTKIL